MKFHLSQLNPFKNVMYKGYFPHSRALRTDFFDKVDDAFDVFCRFFDYPTLGIFFLVTELKDLCDAARKKSLHDKTERFDLILMYMENDQQIDLNNLRQISRQNNNKPILIYQEDKVKINIRIYGLSENGWGITELSYTIANREFDNIDFPWPAGISMLNKRDLPEKAFQEIVSKKGHLSRGFKWFLSGCVKTLAAVFYGLFLVPEFIGDYILRPFFASILLLVSLPMIAVAHLVSKMVAAYKKSQAKTIEVIPEGSTTAITLKQFLNDYEMSLSSLEIAKIKKEIVSTETGDQTKATIKFKLHANVQGPRIVCARSIFNQQNDSRLISLAQTNRNVANKLNSEHYFSKS